MNRSSDAISGSNTFLETGKIMKNFGFLIAAYSAIWILIGYYFFAMNRKIDKLTKKVETLESEKNG